MYIYQREKRFFAKCPTEFLDLVEKELIQRKCLSIKKRFRGISFKCKSVEDIFEINYTSSLISKIYAPLIEFPAPGKKEIYENVMKIKWEDFLTPQKTFSIEGSLSNSKINNSHYAALCVKDAIADYFRKKYGKRPSVNKRDPDLSINIFIENNFATVSLNISGKSLHQRGYRKFSSSAPIQENLAHFMLKLHPYKGKERMLDPFCGSGTLLAEALMIACKIPSGYLRKKWGFFNMPEFNKKIWENIKSKYNKHITEIEYGKIVGSDISMEEIEKAKVNLKNIPFGERIKLTQKDFKEIPAFKGLIFTNPPYGIRMGKKEKLKEMIKDFGDFLKKKCTDSTAYIYFGNRELIKDLGLKTSFKLPVKNGGIDGRIVKVEIY